VDAPPGSFLTFPVEAIVPVPIGEGALLVEATPRAATELVLGSGEGQVTATRGAIAEVTVELFSERLRPSRVRTGPGADPEPDAAALAATDGPPTLAGPDAGAATVDATDPAPGDAAAAADQRPDPVPCAPRTRQLVAEEVVSVDYSLDPPRDAASELVRVASGISHEHQHDFVGWIRFSFAEVPAHATLSSLKVSLVLHSQPQVPPPLAIVYSGSDRWDRRLTSEMAEAIPRTARVSGELGLPRNARAEYPVDAALYRQFWAADLADDAVSFGIISTSPPQEPETWADFHGRQQMLLAPVLELVTCE
jgi:hypothetical protein